MTTKQESSIVNFIKPIKKLIKSQTNGKYINSISSSLIPKKLLNCDDREIEILLKPLVLYRINELDLLLLKTDHQDNQNNPYFNSNLATTDQHNDFDFITLPFSKAIIFLNYKSKNKLQLKYSKNNIDSLPKCISIIEESINKLDITLLILIISILIIINNNFKIVFKFNNNQLNINNSNKNTKKLKKIIKFYETIITLIQLYSNFEEIFGCLYLCISLELLEIRKYADKNNFINKNNENNKISILNSTEFEKLKNKLTKRCLPILKNQNEELKSQFIELVKLFIKNLDKNDMNVLLNPEINLKDISIDENKIISLLYYLPNHQLHAIAPRFIQFNINNNYNVFSKKILIKSLLYWGLKKLELSIDNLLLLSNNPNLLINSKKVSSQNQWHLLDIFLKLLKKKYEKQQKNDDNNLILLKKEFYNHSIEQFLIDSFNSFYLIYELCIENNNPLKSKIYNILKDLLNAINAIYAHFNLTIIHKISNNKNMTHNNEIKQILNSFSNNQIEFINTQSINQMSSENSIQVQINQENKIFKFTINEGCSNNNRIDLCQQSIIESKDVLNVSKKKSNITLEEALSKIVYSNEEILDLSINKIKLTESSFKILEEFLCDKNFKIIDFSFNLLKNIDLKSICEFCSKFNIYIILADNKINIENFIQIRNKNIKGWRRIIFFSEYDISCFENYFEYNIENEMVDQLKKLDIDLEDFNSTCILNHKKFYELYKKTDEKVYFKEIYVIENLDDIILSLKEILHNSNNTVPIKLLNIAFELSNNYIGFENNLENDKKLYQMTHSRSFYLYNNDKNTIYKNTIKYLKEYFFTMTTFDEEYLFEFKKIFNETMVIIKSRIVSLYSILISKDDDKIKKSAKLHDFDLFINLIK